MALDTEVIINGLFSILLITVFVIVGLKILLKYRIYKQNIFILTGFAWIGISEPWWPSAIGFIIALYNNTGLPIKIYLILNNAFLPIFLFCWIMAIGKITEIKKRKLLLVLYALIASIIESIMLYYLFTDTSKVGVYINPVDVDFGPFAMIHILFNLAVFMITGFLFSFKTMKLEEPENKLRGKFLLLAFILFLIGAILETIVTMPPNRVIILLCAVVFYIGFMMPEKVKILFLG
ncbi:MAG: hypothetical protein EU532_13040 [Promethearchaeota archaeon]|nr:MAG: hypothetical protein EU532_13040 [Candidatus Lokiarchaeota archaeon]